ncbi:hypothetical protein ACFWV1_14385 [Streptomyces sp. NPDC058700]
MADIDFRVFVGEVFGRQSALLGVCGRPVALDEFGGDGVGRLIATPVPGA